MKLSLEKIPREFTVNGVRIKDHGKIFLDADEMVSFVTSSGAEFDFTRKAWGFYAPRASTAGWQISDCAQL